ncbi:hypothetical protein ABZ897_45080 [Nonomuraea sp. NPDC046802]|uniref:hypothetical protein n=1 Tax=Nonomuraea sp. NPDC046802 TaxID=3154919 RepID=UPI003406D03D
MSDRQIVGTVGKDGTIYSGSGFTVNRGGKGVYQVAFEEPFTEALAVVATPYNEDTSDFGVATVHSLDREGFRLDARGARSDWTDRGFCFIAVGNDD